MTARAWRRLALAIALFALLGTPAARAFCAASCDTSVSAAGATPHAGHAAVAAVAHEGSGHEHGHGHGAVADPGPATPAGTAGLAAGARACEDLTAASLAGPRASSVSVPPAALSCEAVPALVSARQLRPTPTRPRPRGGAAAPLPLRI